jgi:hypothetical protein
MRFVSTLPAFALTLVAATACSSRIDPTGLSRGGPLSGSPRTDAPTGNPGTPDRDPPRAPSTGNGGVRIASSANGTVCGDDLAATTFRFAVCVCDDASFAARVVTSATGDGGGLAANGSITAAGDLDIGGSLVAGGELAPVGAVHVQHDIIAGADMTFVGDADVGGDAYVGGDLMAIGLGVAGTVHANADANVFGAGPAGVVREDVSVNPPCACGDDARTDVVGIVTAAATDNDNAANAIDPNGLEAFAGDLALTVPAGRTYFDSVAAAGRVVLTVTGPAAVFVGDDVALAGALEVILDGDDASLDLFIAGDLAAAGALDIGSAVSPSKVRVYVGGAGDIAIAGDADLGASLFAPDARVALAGSFTFDGALVAGSIAHAGDLVVNYDSSVLDGAGGDCDAGDDDGDVGGDDGATDPVDGDDGTGGDNDGDDGGDIGGDEPGTCDTAADCGNQACNDGVCGACSNSLDCAAPLTCIEGSCAALSG